MKKTYLKGLSFVVMIAIVASNFSLSTVRAQNSQDNEQEKQYIVITNNENSFNAVSDEYQEFISEDYENNGDLQEENILVTEMTAAEAQSIESESGVVLVEEDGLVTASVNNNSNNSRNKEKTKANKKENSKNNIDKEWNIKAVNADDENKDSIISSSEKIKVAIIDSGLDVTGNIDVAGRINLIPGEEEVLPLFEDTTGHGTSIAGIISANNDYEYSDVKGINDQVELYSAKVLDATNSAPISRVIAGIYWAIEQNVDIINLSFGTTQNSEALYLAVKAAYDAGILIIAASGNSGGAIEYPAAYPEVMAVGSVDATGTISDFCSTGADMEVVAPGELIKATGGFGGEIIVSGTSMSVPHVVGIASVLWQKDKTKLADFIRQLINESANYLGDVNIYGNGLVDLSYALEIYDEFAKTYVPNSVGSTVNAFENDSEVENFSDVDYVNGTWTHTLHETAVLYGDYNNGIVISSNDIYWIKAGANWPDTEWSGMNHKEFHGNNAQNYVASYVLMMQIASGNKNYPISEDILKYELNGNFPVPPYDRFGSIISHLATARNLNNTYSPKPTESQQKNFALGVAIHAGTDAFAHATIPAWTQEPATDGSLIPHTDLFPIEKPNGISDADDSDYLPQRFTGATALATYAIYRFYNNDLSYCKDDMFWAYGLSTNNWQNVTYWMPHLYEYGF